MNDFGLLEETASQYHILGRRQIDAGHSPEAVAYSALAAACALAMTTLGPDADAAVKRAWKATKRAQRRAR